MFIHMSQTDSTAKRFVAYFRVSSQKQGADGLGIAAQKEIVARFVENSGGEVVASFTEVESGKRADNRPQLAAALREAKRQNATVLVGKLDRLGRNLAFIASLMEAGTPFVACDFPAADRLMLHMLAAFAEHERSMISKRTREALAQAKARGVRLGNPQIATVNQMGRDTQAAKAQSNAELLAGIVLPMRKQGASLRAIADRLTAQGIKTARGGSWSASHIQHILKRVA